MSSLSALSALISSGVASIEATYAKNGATFPSLEDPFRGPEPLGLEIMESAALVIAAAGQLIATLRLPPLSVIDAAAGMYPSAAVGAACEFNVAEILREAGPQGLHVASIAAKAHTDSGKLGRILRLLASRHIFKEVSPDVFANNRISSALDTGKSVDEIQFRPLDKHENTSGIPALISMTTDESLKSAGYIIDNLVDIETASSQEVTDTPFNRAFGTRLQMWEWYELPENAKRLRRFGAAMRGTTRVFPPEQVINAYDWKSLKKGDLVVDVGGGIGSTTLRLAQAFPELRFVVQDRELNIPAGIKFFQDELPDALSSGQVKFQGHDFFAPQPIKDADIFLMRFISHDWPDRHVKTILSQLRASAQPTTKLLIMDNIVPYACPTSSEFPDIPGSEIPPVPSPLLPNLGIANARLFATDMTMMACLNAQERTVGQFVAVVDGTGWKLSSINRSPAGGALPVLVFIHV